MSAAATAKAAASRPGPADRAGCALRKASRRAAVARARASTGPSDDVQDGRGATAACGFASRSPGRARADATR